MARGPACRDCRLCTGNAFTGMGSGAKRLGVNIATLGVAALARRTCKLCGHPMAEHASLNGEMVVAAPGQSWPAAWYPEGERERWYDGVRWTDNYRDAPAALPASPAPVDTVAELERLASLHERGVLTDEEFTAAKAKLLGT